MTWNDLVLMFKLPLSHSVIHAILDDQNERIDFFHFIGDTNAMHQGKQNVDQGMDTFLSPP